MQRLVVHPGEHQHLTGVVLLDDGGDQPGGVAAQQRGDRRVEGGTADMASSLPRRPGASGGGRTRRLLRTSAGRGRPAAARGPTIGAAAKNIVKAASAASTAAAREVGRERHQPDRPVDGEHELHGVRADQRAATRVRLRRLSASTPPTIRSTTESTWTAASTVPSVVSDSIREDAKIAGSSCAARPIIDVKNQR